MQATRGAVTSDPRSSSMGDFNVAGGRRIWDEAARLRPLVGPFPLPWSARMAAQLADAHGTSAELHTRHPSLPGKVPLSGREDQYLVHRI
jgi:hypothetical protein